MSDEILGAFDIGEFVVRINHENSHGARGAHKRQRFLDCPARFADG